MNDTEPSPPADAVPTSPVAAAAAPVILPNAPDTFCTYLARQLIAKRNHSENVYPEAAPLAAHCDILLSSSDGYSVGLTCLVDREAHPGKTFDMTPDEVKAVGKECLQYAGTLYGSKIPIAIQIMEVGPSEDDPTQRARLWHYSPGWFSRVQPAGWIIDPIKKTLWTTARFGGRGAGAGLIRQWMDKPREDVSQLQPAPAVAASAAEFGFPYLTVAIIAVLCALFAAEVIFGIGPTTGLLQPSIDTLIAFGGIQKPLIVNGGQWTRLFSGPLLHVGLEHLLLNCIALFIAGRILEGLVGRAWLAATFVIGAVVGALFSLALNPENLVSVGASGAVMALFAALLMLSFHFPKGPDRTALRMNSIYVLAASMIPVATSGGGRVDIAAHLGGALAGIAVGLVMLPLWKKDEMRPRLSSAAAAVGVIGLALFVFAFKPLPENQRKAMFTAYLIPGDDFPKTDEEASKRSAELVEKYPTDPRSHYFRAIALWDQGDKAAAEKALRVGLANESFWRPLMVPELSIRLHTALAILLADDGRMAEAKQAAKLACELAGADNPQREFLNKHSLCAP